MYIFSVPVFQQFSDPQLAKIADVLEEVCINKVLTYISTHILDQDFYEDGEYIIRQGWAGDAFFIINEGQVKVTQQQDSGKEVVKRKLGKGDYFGEKALLGYVTYCCHYCIICVSYLIVVMLRGLLM